jgi:hypothetical protein
VIETTVQLICDECETVYPAQPNHTGSAVVIRMAAQEAGWSTTGRGRNLRDRCPSCRRPPSDWTGLTSDDIDGSPDEFSGGAP